MYKQSLNGEWQVARVGSNEWIPATVPGCIHTDLLRAGIIPDPFYGDNELKVEWVHHEDWVYKRTFLADELLLAQEHVFLQCEGLDTVAFIRLNGREIAYTDNMHRTWEIEVTNTIKQGENVIEIEFISPVKYVTQRLKEKQWNIISPSDSIPGSPLLRKAMYQWGWDWAPKLPTSGIWRNIQLVGYSVARLTDVYIRQIHQEYESCQSMSDRVDRNEVYSCSGIANEEGNVHLIVEFSIQRWISCPLVVQVSLTSPEGDVEWKEFEVAENDTRGRVEFLIEYPELWWPNGYGGQPLYRIDVSLNHKEDSRRTGDLVVGSCLSKVSKRIGLRSLKLVQDPDEWGRTFYFCINGVPIFAKGADWVPPDQFPSRVTEEQYHDLIQSAASANMNMLRVWGGGIYEDDCFYDLCDEYGILVWQDFMFACAHYPSEPDFLENVRQEAIDNLRRLRHHPCLVLWCGNNEQEWFFTERWAELDGERRKEYLALYYGLLPEIVCSMAPDIPYWPASPASSKPFDNPNGENEGDSHYWDVWHGRLPFKAYREHYPRFMSEFGFESLPSIKTIKSFSEPGDWSINSYIMEHHQKNSAGNSLILYYMSDIFRLPTSFPMTVYVSQLLQAEALRYGVEHWRRNRNKHRCMGTVYWQYNDCWPVASWSSIDYYHRWKALQYFARRFYAPVLLSVKEDENSAELHVTNDLVEPFTGTVRWSLEKVDGAKLAEGCIPVRVPPLTDVCVAQMDFSEHLNGQTRFEVVLVYELYKDDVRLSMGVVSFVSPRFLKLPRVNLTSEVIEEGGKFHVKLKTDKLARYVMLDIPDVDVRFSDNYFDLPAGRAVVVTLDIVDGTPLDDLANRLRVVSLVDSYLE
jgi:beta-mannosidase